jgi:hypothetical protein
MFKTAHMVFDINIQPKAHDILAPDEPEEVD